MSDDFLLEAKSLFSGYDGRRDIISGISLTLGPGERLGIIGPNGCGKTTLLRVLAGILTYRGSLLLRGAERSLMGSREAARETGFLSQLSSAYFSYSVEETVMLGRYSHQNPGWPSHSSAADREAVGKALESCGLGSIRGEILSHLSGGQLQRVFLARTLAQDPAVLLLDEPTNHLDLYYQLELLDRIAEWTENGNHAAIGVFHDLNLASRFSHRLILIDEGRIVDEGTPRAVLGGPELRRVYRMDVAASMRSLLQNW